MSASIGSSTSVKHAQHVAPQVKPTARDSDGDNDGSKPKAVERPKATSGSIGTIINTKA